MTLISDRHICLRNDLMMLNVLRFSRISSSLTNCHTVLLRQNILFTWRKLSTSSNDRDATVRLDNIFSDYNREKVVAKMKDAKPLYRPEKLMKKGREAAVLVPMCHIEGEPALLFMMRSRYLKNHRGEISFPGGMKDPSDRDLIHTALRETFEEIGLPEDCVDVWGTIPPSPSRNGGWVTPVLGYCNNIKIEQLNLNHSEVEEVFVRKISTLCDPANQRMTQWRYLDTRGYTLPVFLGEEHRIWGLTAIFIHQVLNLIAPGLYNFKLNHKS
ncbi:mitochondrial coenzyme A diphosphatase NUDT8-like isoform X2 [Mercenaria mercenaria]|uniref:mitochondrial coenzyme A diphosphatase NUDT8-like isoform X2 n=1 Tax=Mercenaria mercenaria TaxID=6596 RepID=UPI00234E6142|nr:mitochondrial coenzyme A diphosphatase NUDT8-like isoform X2 [Mercenaria mercenaria]